MPNSELAPSLNARPPIIAHSQNNTDPKFLQDVNRSLYRHEVKKLDQMIDDWPETWPIYDEWKSSWHFLTLI